MRERAVGYRPLLAGAGMSRTVFNTTVSDFGKAARRAFFMATAAAVALGLAACSNNDMDWDLRRSGGFSTAEAARQATPRRPQPDSRGVISYPGYQVAIAQPGERASDVAGRLGIDAAALARHNAIEADTPLRGGETLVLPSRVADAGGMPPAAGTGPIAVTSLDGAGQSAATEAEPVRHQVRRGETVFTIARLYDVSARSLAEWNGLPADMAVREGQLLIVPRPQTIAEASATQTAALQPPIEAPRPPTVPAAGTSLPAPQPQEQQPQPTAPATSTPGQGSPTPVPPSASQPLPEEDPAPAGQGASAAAPATPPVADMSAQRTEGPRLAMPVEGRIIRAYARGRNDGIGIGAPAGTQVRAAAAGTVAAITRDTEQVPILVVRHENNLLTVYANIDDIRVERGARVTRGQTLATVRQGDPSFLHFEVREGFESVDPMPYLQ